MDNNMNAPQAGSKNGLVWSIVIVVLVIALAIYMFGRPSMMEVRNDGDTQMQDESGSSLNINSSTTVDQSSQSNSDDIDSIDKDLNDTDLNSLEE